MVKFMNKKGLCQLKIDTCHLHLQKLYHGHCNCWLSTALKGVQGKDQEWGAPCSGKNWQNRPSDIRSFQEILWSQFLHLLIPRETLTSLMVTSALAIKKNFKIKSQNRVLSYGSDILGNNQVLLQVKFQIRRCNAKHLSFLSRVRLRCHHSQNNDCWTLVTSTLLFIKLGNWPPG